MWSLACKHVFYRPEHNAKGKPHGNEFLRSSNAKSNIPTDITERLNKKMGSFV